MESGEESVQKDASTPVRRKVRKKPRLGYFEQKALKAAKEAAAAAAAASADTPDTGTTDELRKSQGSLATGGGALPQEQDLKGASFAELVYLVQSGKLGGEEALSAEEEAAKMRGRSASEQSGNSSGTHLIGDDKRRASESQVTESEDKNKEKEKESACDSSSHASGQSSDAWGVSGGGGATTWGDRMEEELKREQEQQTAKKTTQKPKKAKKAKKKRKKSKAGDLSVGPSTATGDLTEFQFPEFADGPKSAKETSSDNSRTVNYIEKRAPGLVVADNALALAAAAVLAAKSSANQETHPENEEKEEEEEGVGGGPLLEEDSWEKLYDSPKKDHIAPAESHGQEKKDSLPGTTERKEHVMSTQQDGGRSLRAKDSLLAGAMAQLQEWKHSDSNQQHLSASGSEFKLEEGQELAKKLADAAGIEEERLALEEAEKKRARDEAEREKEHQRLEAEKAHKEKMAAKRKAEQLEKERKIGQEKKEKEKAEEKKRLADEKKRLAEEKREEEKRAVERRHGELRERLLREEEEKQQKERREEERKEKQRMEEERKREEEERRQEEREEAERKMEEETRREEERREKERKAQERKAQENREADRQEQERKEREMLKAEEEERAAEERAELKRRELAALEAAQHEEERQRELAQLEAKRRALEREERERKARKKSAQRAKKRANEVAKKAKEEKERAATASKRAQGKGQGKRKNESGGGDNGAHNVQQKAPQGKRQENDTSASVGSGEEGSSCARAAGGELQSCESSGGVESLSQQSEAAAVLFIVLLGFYLANYDYEVPLRGLMSAGEIGRILQSSPPFSWLSWQILSELGTRNCVVLFRMLTAFIVTSTAIVFHGTLLSLIAFSPKNKLEKYFPLIVSICFGLGTSTYALVARFSAQGLYESVALFSVVSGVYLYNFAVKLRPSPLDDSHRDIALTASGVLLSVPVILDGSLVVLPLCFGAHLLLLYLKGSVNNDREIPRAKRHKGSTLVVTERASLFSCVFFTVAVVAIVASAFVFGLARKHVESDRREDSHMESGHLSPMRRANDLLVFLFSPSGGVFTFSPVLLFAFLGLAQALTRGGGHKGKGPTDVLLACAAVAVLYLSLCGFSAFNSRTTAVVAVPFLLLLVGNALHWVMAKKWRISLFVTVSLLSIGIQLIASGPALEDGRWERKSLYHIYSPHAEASERTLLHSTSDSALAARLGEYLVLDIECQDVALSQYRHRLWSLTDSLLFDIAENWKVTLEANREAVSLFEAAMDSAIAQNLESATLEAIESVTDEVDTFTTTEEISLPVEELLTKLDTATEVSSEEEKESTTESVTSFGPTLLGQRESGGISAAELFGKPQRVLHFLYVGADGGVNLGHEAFYANFVSFATSAGAEEGVRVVVTPLRLAPPIDSTMGCTAAAASLAFLQIDYGQYDGIVLGGGSTVAEHYLCPLQVDGALGHFPQLPVMLFGSGFDDLSLITADKNVMRQLRQGRFDAISFGRTSGLVTQVSDLLDRGQLFGGFRGSYSEMFVEKMTEAVSTGTSVSLSERTGLQALGDAGLLSGLALEKRKESLDVESVCFKYGILAGQRYVMVNYGSPSEGTRHMYGKGSQLLGTSLDMLINDLSQQFVVVLYSTSTSDLENVLSLREIVTTVGVNPSRVVAIPTVPTVTEILSLMRGTELHIGFRFFSSVLSVVAKCPFVAIAYRFKTVEFMDSVGLSQFVVTTGDCTYSSLQIMSRRAMENREKFSVASDAAVAHAATSYSHQTRLFTRAAMTKRGLRQTTVDASGPPLLLSSPPLRVLYVGSVGQEQRSAEASFVYRALGTALASVLDWKLSLSSVPLEMEVFSPSVGHLQPPASPRSKAFGSFDMDAMLQWLDTVEMEQLYPIPWSAYDLVVFGNALFPDPVMEQFLISFLSHQSEDRENAAQLLFWGTDCDIHRMFDDVAESTIQMGDLTSDEFEHWNGVHDLDRQLLAVYNDVLPSVYALAVGEMPGTPRQLPLCTRALDERLSLLYHQSLLSPNVSGEDIRQMGLDGSTVAAASLLTDVTTISTHTVTGARHLPTLTSLPHFIRKRLPIDLTRSSAPIIGLHYAAIADNENSGLSKDRKAVFGRRVADNIEALTSICKAVQHLSDDGYTIVLFTSAVGGIRGEQPLDDLKSMWSFIRAGAEHHSSVQRNVVLLPEVLDVSYLSQLLGSFEVVLSVGGDYSGTGEAQSHFSIGLSLSLDVPVFHLASGNSGVELMHALDLSDWVLPLPLLKSGAMLHSILTHLLLDRDPLQVTEELVARVALHKADALQAVLSAAEGALL